MGLENIQSFESENLLGGLRSDTTSAALSGINTSSIPASSNTNPAFHNYNANNTNASTEEFDVFSTPESNTKPTLNINETNTNPSPYSYNPVTYTNDSSNGSDSLSPNTNPSSSNIDIEAFCDELRKIGIEEEDIYRVITGQITVEGLWNEIFEEGDKRRQRLVIETMYIHNFAEDITDFSFDYDNIDEITDRIKFLRRETYRLEKEEAMSKVSVVKATIGLFDYMAGQYIDLDTAIEEYKVLIEYEDAQGNTHYTTDFRDLPNDITNYKDYSYKDLFGDSEMYQQLLELMPLHEKEYTILFKKETRNVRTLEWTEEQTAFFEQLNYQASQEPEPDFYNYSASTQALEYELASLEEIKDFIKTQAKYYVNFILPYIKAPDFEINSKYDPSIGEAAIESISKKVYGYDNYVNVSSKEEMIGLLSEAFNNENSTLSYGYIFTNNNYYYATILSNDEVFMHFLTDWSKTLTEDEIQVFNYIVNTEGAEAAYEYLEDLSSTIDQRWYKEKQKNDIQWAQEHPFLASFASVIITPAEGIAAACYSLNSLMTGAELRRTDVYSAGNTYRGAVSAHISEKYSAEWAFAYDTFMSMADTAALIGLDCVTGGTCTVFLSAATMGSRAYVSALNEALDRGVSPEKAILFGAASAFVETICEEKSLGHLMDLEKTLSAGTQSLITNLSNQIADPVKRNILEKTLYIAAGAISQGLCEGEEELCTEILNSFCDQLICGDLSQFSLAIENYIDAGYDEDTAILYAFRDKGQDCALAFAGGFCSGIFFGGFKAGKITYNASRANIDVFTMEKIDEMLHEASSPHGAGYEATNIMPALYDPHADTVTIGQNRQIYQAYIITSGIDSKKYVIPIQSVHNYIFDISEFRSFFNLSGNIREAYVEGIKRYEKVLKTNGIRIDKYTRNRIHAMIKSTPTINYFNNILSNPLILNFKDVKNVNFSADYFNKILFNNEEYNRMVSIINTENNAITLAKFLAPFHILYNMLKINQVIIPEFVKTRLNFFNDYFTYISSKVDSIFLGLNRYGVAQQSVNTLANNPSMNIDLYNTIAGIVSSYFPGINKFEINNFLRSIDVIGVCSYAAVINELLSIYSNRENDFIRDFGFPLFRYENGRRIINEEVIITDFYCYANRLNTKVIKREYGYYNIAADDQNQIFMANLYTGINTNMINNWLMSKGIGNRQMTHTIGKNLFINISNQDIDYYQTAIAESIAAGHTLTIGIYGPLSYTYYPLDGGQKIECNGNHIVMITGLTADGNLIVSSWGRRFILYWSEIKYNVFSIDENWIE